MALTYTIAGLRAALDAWETSFAAAVGAVPTSALWDTARGDLATYETIWAGLPEKVTLEGVSANMPHPDALQRTLDKALAHEERKLRAASNRRLIRARTSFPR